MTFEWKEDQPIYRQLRDKVVEAIIDGSLAEGEAIPSVRQVAVDFQINPLTAQKAYAELVTDGLVEKRRGLGMFVMEGARAKLLSNERDQFLNEEWPAITARIKALGLNVEDLLKSATTPKNGK